MINGNLCLNRQEFRFWDSRSRGARGGDGDRPLCLHAAAAHDAGGLRNFGRGGRLAGIRQLRGISDRCPVRHGPAGPAGHRGIRCGGLLAIGLTTLAMGIEPIALGSGSSCALSPALRARWCWGSTSPPGALERLALFTPAVAQRCRVRGCRSRHHDGGRALHRAHASPRWDRLKPGSPWGILSLVLDRGDVELHSANRRLCPDYAERAAIETASTGWYREAARLVFSYGAFSSGYIIPATFLPAMAREVIQDPAVFGWSWPAFGAAAALSTLAAAWLAPSIANRSLWIASQLVMTCGVALPVVLAGPCGDLALRAAPWGARSWWRP